MQVENVFHNFLYQLGVNPVVFTEKRRDSVDPFLVYQLEGKTEEETERFFPVYPIHMDMRCVIRAGAIVVLIIFQWFIDANAQSRKGFPSR